MHLSADGLVVCAPISLLPQLKTTQESSLQDNLQKLESLEASLEAPGPKDLCQSEKVATRQKLLGLNQSLNVFMSFNLSNLQPSRALRPATRSERRITIEDGGLVRSYLWDANTKTSEWQSTDFANFHSLVRMSTLQDEGDCTGAMSMAQSGLSVHIHRDTSHKLAREEVLAAAAVPEIAIIKKQVALICKYDKAPWKSSSFGRRIAEAKELVTEIPDDHCLIQMCSAGIFDDLQMSPASSLQDAKAALISFAKKGRSGTGSEHKSGRWCDFVDSFARLRKEWHSRLFFHLFALVLEGKNPMHALATSFEKLGTEDDLALQPKVLRAPRPLYIDSLGSGTSSVVSSFSGPFKCWGQACCDCLCVLSNL